MSEFENEDIDKMFEAIISSDDLDGIKSSSIEGIINVENVSIESLLKEFTLIFQSISRAAVHVGDLMFNYLSVEDYSTDQELKEILGNIYKLTEDLDEYMVELMFEDTFDDLELDEGEEDDE